MFTLFHLLNSTCIFLEKKVVQTGADVLPESPDNFLNDIIFMKAFNVIDSMVVSFLRGAKIK